MAPRSRALVEPLVCPVTGVLLASVPDLRPRIRRSRVDFEAHAVDLKAWREGCLLQGNLLSGGVFGDDQEGSSRSL